MYNPAHRLATILLDFDRHCASHPNPYDNWRAALKLNPYAEYETVHICFVRVLQLSDDVRSRILCAPASPPHGFQQTLNELRHYLLRYAFEESAQTRQRYFPQRQIDRLQSLARTYPPEAAAPPAMKTFLQQFAELHGIVLANENVAPDTKQFVCEFLQWIIYALEYYNVGGARGVVNAMDLALGAMSRHAQLIRKTPEHVQAALYDLLNRLDRFTAPLNGHDPHVGATLALLGFGLTKPPPKKAA